MNDIGSGVKSSVKLFVDDYTIYNEIRSKADCEVYKRILMQFSVGHRNGIHVSLNFSSGLSMGVLSRQKPEHILLSFVPT